MKTKRQAELIRDCIEAFEDLHSKYDKPDSELTQNYEETIVIKRYSHGEFEAARRLMNRIIEEKFEND